MLNSRCGSLNECKTYYYYLQANLIDPRDNQGKRHDFHRATDRFVLFGVLLATMAGKAFIAEIRRFLVRHHDSLCCLLDISIRYTVSDVQLRRLLALVEEQAYQRFHAGYFDWLVLYQSLEICSDSRKRLSQSNAGRFSL